ncbi:glucose PTS transporter subunit IIA [Lactiplantibacillus pentosus]|uniref:Glucose PTS transporter subunit IIA n=5 Tax=Lactiplantibacillus pentosus TaxID=1589 RepID=A0AAX6LE66_LACPE|nr:PTS glucose transporter subunit IIABC [Lactiplantibacillus pentosus]AYJ43110.1 PTS beta-glucoside transporter subunit IIABC [Lactiplantibacillus pentosus]MBU7474420.1 glucose PTS transporter subunit IIA [Lactiplantibacillus pentosus]MBU7495715.1 glucose PTS transporter subunit IIA [Lactiplantibacillus pentosus]MBU7529678.1 glucose PTS transporter subunit IIA [Lactiplantibacillus pentosus]MCT3300232.1 PTS beta-glucoside transporter subunit IIABC [Lactiplantibacillus pentosus]
MKQVHLLTPVAGQLVPLKAVHDPVFSQGMMGEGFGIEPTEGQVVAPISGKVTMVAASLHAIGFTGNNGLEVLVHLGIDTVELAENPPFTVTVHVGDTVEAGDKIATMDLMAIANAHKATTVIMAVTNSMDHVTKLTPEVGEVRAGVVGAVVELKEDVPEQPIVKGQGGKYDELATQIIAQVGGPVNIKSVIHCITRVRFYLKDEGKADDDAIRNLKGVIDVAKAGGQYQVVIGPAVNDVYDAIVGQLGAGFGDADASAVAMEKEANRLAWQKMSPWQKVKHGFSSLIGVITGSMIPVIGLLAASGILKGILSLLTNFKIVSATTPTYVIINAMGDSVFYFLPIFVGFTAAKKLGADPVIMGIVGGVLTYPAIVGMATTGKVTGHLLGMAINANFFGIPVHVASYTYSIFPMIAGAWLASKLEPWLKRVIPTVLRMIFVPLFEVVLISGAIILILGPVITALSGALAAGIVAIYKLSPAISGLIIGGFYQVLVIFGLHWAIIPIVVNDITTTGHSYLNAIVSATMVAQGGAVLAIALKSKFANIKELAWPATISAFCGVTEPAMYGINLKYGRAFITASIGGAVGGFLTGLFNVNMWGFAGSLIGFTSFFNPKGIDFSFYGFLIASAADLIVAFALTWMFGFSDNDVKNVKTAPKKKHLGQQVA